MEKDLFMVDRFIKLLAWIVNALRSVIENNNVRNYQTRSVFFLFGFMKYIEYIQNINFRIQRFCNKIYLYMAKCMCISSVGATEIRAYLQTLFLKSTHHWTWPTDWFELIQSNFVSQFWCFQISKCITQHLFTIRDSQ